jgi:hypothetical protein
MAEIVSSASAHPYNDARATLDAWREQGADRLDPVRFRFIEAMVRRAADHEGEARRVIDERLSGLLEAYSGDLERDVVSRADASPDTVCEKARGPLAGLVAHIASHAASDGEGSTLPRLSSNPELKALDYFRQTWSKVSTERQLRQSLEQVPGNAGPLNSSSLVHRSLSLMRELSPGYLQQFLSYVDALSWMEQIAGGVAAPAKEVPRAASAKKGTRSKSR